MLIVFTITICFIKFNIYEKYTAIYKDNSLIIKNYSFPFSKSSKIYIDNIKYKYNIISINKNTVILKIKLQENLKINGNKIDIYILKSRANIYKILKNKWKDVVYIEKNE